jgi:hypothetical protein
VSAVVDVAKIVCLAAVSLWALAAAFANCIDRDQYHWYAKYKEQFHKNRTLAHENNKLRRKLYP